MNLNNIFYLFNSSYLLHFRSRLIGDLLVDICMEWMLLTLDTKIFGILHVFVLVFIEIFFAFHFSFFIVVALPKESKLLRIYGIVLLICHYGVTALSIRNQFRLSFSWWRCVFLLNMFSSLHFISMIGREFGLTRQILSYCFRLSLLCLINLIRFLFNVFLNWEWLSVIEDLLKLITTPSENVLSLKKIWKNPIKLVAHWSPRFVFVFACRLSLECSKREWAWMIGNCIPPSNLEIIFRNIK